MTIQRDFTSAGPEAEDQATSAANFERRKMHRVEMDAPGWLSGESGNPASAQQEVMVTSLSLNGAGFRGTRDLAGGAVHWLVIAAGSLRVSSRSRVVRSVSLPNGEFDCGVEFF